MNSEIQFMDVIEPLKQMIAEQAYQLAYKDAVIKTQDKENQELKAAIEAMRKQKEKTIDEAIETLDERDR